MKKLLYLFILLVAAGCKEKYVPPFTAPAEGYLVVEGNINNGSSTTIILTRTNTLIATNKIFETGAVVAVEGNDNSSYLFTENSTGYYYINQLNLNPAQQYRLNIKTSDGKQYLSDFVSLKLTPPIDSLTWQREDNGLQIYVNAHDDQGNSRYYQWDFEETWEFHSPFLHVLDYNDTDPNNPFLRYRDSGTFSADPAIRTCWNSHSSNTLLIGSTAKLSSDRVYLPLNYIPPATKQLSVLYSIKVRQFVLSKEAYEFLEKMKKNTESNGSIFDPQPSELKGNIHCVSSPDEPVIGFVNISSLMEKRIFISSSEVKNWNYSTGCVRYEIQNQPDSIKFAYNNGGFPTEIASSRLDGSIMSFYIAIDNTCVDCTLTGTNVKPVFWP